MCNELYKWFHEYEFKIGFSLLNDCYGLDSFQMQYKFEKHGLVNEKWDILQSDNQVPNKKSCNAHTVTGTHEMYCIINSGGTAWIVEEYAFLIGSDLAFPSTW